MYAALSLVFSSSPSALVPQSAQHDVLHIAFGFSNLLKRNIVLYFAAGHKTMLRRFGEAWRDAMEDQARRKKYSSAPFYAATREGGLGEYESLLEIVPI